MPPKDKYSDPKLRDEVKEEIKQSDKGGEPGQWSARKAQMMAKEYKQRGGDYNTPKESKDESQKNLDNWGKEDWQTKEGSGHAKQEDGSRKRYLPKKAWDQLSEKEKKQTDDKKQEEGKEGQQFVSNTSEARSARRNARAKAKDGGDDENKGASDEDEGNEKPTPDKKRGRKTKDDGDQDQKKQKTDTKDEEAKNGTVGSKHDKSDPPAQQGSNDRLPKKGQKDVHWKALPGWVHGEVVEIVTSSKSVEGKQIKASKSDPRIVLRSKSGKICVHKPDNIYFD
ncbi:hypothetical protein N0V93_008295 [Gnomoniopsis smithogilvyi]|uniref:Hypervirulence associated protein TUDOR domain-containing protein n=1 Tax=Gnomoniopsis smithogilvyi TaxID=1191159 RepID=A0A9W8YMX3_9PEZI|nr:hypothetical protein N0V93_008295 [Gnomoniopsis smithogilvyi]